MSLDIKHLMRKICCDDLKMIYHDTIQRNLPFVLNQFLATQLVSIKYFNQLKLCDLAVKRF